MEDYGRFQIKTLIGKNAPREKLESFLLLRGLKLEKDIEYSYLLVEDDQIAATASLSGNMIKCVAVDEKYEGMGLAATVVGKVIEEAYSRGIVHLFLCTKPMYLETFRGLGFRKLAECKDRAVFLENDSHGIERYTEKLKQFRKDGISGCIVMNANPFTNGHRYLTEMAASSCDHLHIFLVKEDKSDFPYDIRYRLVKEGTADIPNVTVHEGSQYILSASTFPSYFIRDTGVLAETYSAIDAVIFSDYIAPALNISKRFLGEEPYSETTRTYNCILSSVLPQKGIDVEIIRRLELDGMPVSASEVRRLFLDKEYEKIERIVPVSTYGFITSEEGQKLRDILEKNT